MDAEADGKTDTLEETTNVEGHEKSQTESDTEFSPDKKNLETDESKSKQVTQDTNLANTTTVDN